MLTEEEWNADAAVDVVAIVHTDDAPDAIGILDDNGNLALIADKNLARAIAVRIVELSAEIPDPPVTLPSGGDRL